MKTFWSFKGEVDYVDQWILMRTPFPLFIISVSYLWFIFNYGPRFMKTRKPYNINSILIINNVSQVFYCIYLCYIKKVVLKYLVQQNCFLLYSSLTIGTIWMNFSANISGTHMIWKKGLLPKTCSLGTQENEYLIATSIYAYFIAKVSELLETVFFVLRKKNEQVSFLHVYHHLAMMWCSWFILKYEPSYDSTFLRTINSYVHVIMYSYYTLATFPQISKYLWWKKYITSIQLIQFGLVILHGTVNAIYPGCPPTKPLMTMIYVNGGLFIYLFAKFYIRSYTHSDKTKSEFNKINIKSYSSEKIKT